MQYRERLGHTNTSHWQSAFKMNDFALRPSPPADFKGFTQIYNPDFHFGLCTPSKVLAGFFPAKFAKSLLFAFPCGGRTHSVGLGPTGMKDVGRPPRFGVVPGGKFGPEMSHFFIFPKPPPFDLTMVQTMLTNHISSEHFFALRGRSEAVWEK